MRNNKLKYALGVAAFILFPVTCGWAAEYVCPREIGTDQKLSSSISDWRVFRDKDNEHYRLDRIDLYDGPPEEKADLVPDNEDHSADVESEWTFSSTTGRRIWLVCIYQNTAIKLSRELPASTRKCKVVYAKEPGRQIQSLQCD